MNWSFLKHLIGDMRNGEEYTPVLLKLNDKMVPVDLRRDSEDGWYLVPMEQPEVYDRTEEREGEEDDRVDEQDGAGLREARPLSGEGGPQG